MRERSRVRTLRCAVYTRKSSEEGLEQDFNSLQAQREACEAYIASQKHEGWKVLPAAYDDGAYSGGTMDRPALQRLLAYISSGQVDVVVVYKVDRLTRALADFAKIVDVFDRRGVSFVSVTQQFNTTTSMGRLTLNVLLSFAQFEREVTGERIRDKIAASKKKGLWMGGFVPLGYRKDQRTLVIHEGEAEIVRRIFGLYLDSGSVLKVEAELRAGGVVRPISNTLGSGRCYGGRPFSRGEIYKLLSNPIYMGEIGHKGQRYGGQHPAIIDPEIWGKVRARLGENTYARHIRQGAKDPSLLAGLLYDDRGNRLTPTHCVKKGKRYRYYAQQRTGSEVRGSGRPPESERRWRIAATEIETVVIGQLAARCENPLWLDEYCIEPGDSVAHRRSIASGGKALADRLRTDDAPRRREILLNLLSRVVLAESEVRIDLRRSALLAALGAGQGTIGSERTGPRQDAATLPSIPAGAVNGACELGSYGSGSEPEEDTIVISVATKLRRRGAETKLIIECEGDSAQEPTPDPALIKLLANALQWWDDLVAQRFETVRELAGAYGKNQRYVARVLPLAFLQPASVELIAAGKQSIDMTAHSAITSFEVPFRWAAPA